MWKKIKKFFHPWPKRIRIEVRDGQCRLIDFKFVNIKSWDEIFPLGEAFCQEVMRVWECEDLDEVYWHYEEAEN